MALHLDLQKFQAAPAGQDPDGGVAQTDNRTRFSGSGNGNGPGPVHDQAFAAEEGEGPGPGCETPDPAVQFPGRQGPVQSALFLFQRRGVGGLLRVLLDRFESPPAQGLQRFDQEVGPQDTETVV